MNFIAKISNWFNPVLHLILANAISLLAAILAFRSIEMDSKTLVTFVAYYLFLGLVTAMYAYRKLLTNPATLQLMQFSLYLLGFVLIVTGVLGMFNGGQNMAAVFLLVVFLPGLACLRAGLLFKKNGD